MSEKTHFRLLRERHEGWIKKAFFLHIAKIQECSSQSMLRLPLEFYMLKKKMRNHPNVGFANKSFEATHITKT